MSHALSNTVSRTDQKGNTAVMTYNDLHRLIDRTISDPQQNVLLSESFTHNRRGGLLTANNALAQVTNVYDSLGRPDSTTQRFLAGGGVDYLTAFGYTIIPSHNLSTRTITAPGPNGTVTTEYFDARGRFDQVFVYQAVSPVFNVDWDYDSGNRRSQITRSNGVTTTFGYDVNDRLTSLTHANLVQNLFDVDYGYDAVGNRLWKQDNVRTDHGEFYSYDRRNRLIGMNRGVLDPGSHVITAELQDPVKPGLQAWLLDSRGNWSTQLERVNNILTFQTRVPNAVNEYTSITPPTGGPVTPTYDNNGNLGLDPLAPNAGVSAPAGQVYEYDAANRLTRVRRSSDNQLLLEIGYDALGRRVETKEYVSPVDGSVLATPNWTWHVFAGLEPIVEESVIDLGGGAVSTSLAREFVWGPSFPEPVALIDHTWAGDSPPATPEILSYTHDALGSVTGLTDSAGNLVEQYVYDPYGQTYIEDAGGNARSVSHYDNPYMWTGQRRDATTGTYHFWARSYNPTLGRWHQRDPLGYVDGASLYGYASANALRWVDPLGLLPHDGMTEVITRRDKREARRRGNSTIDYDASPETPYPHMVGQVGTLLEFARDLRRFMKQNPNMSLFKIQELFINSSSNRYVYMNRVGWVDMQHFVASAYLQDKTGRVIAWLLGLGKEIRDFPGESSFRRSDLRGNNKGRKFMRWFREQYGPGSYTADDLYIYLAYWLMSDDDWPAPPADAPKAPSTQPRPTTYDPANDKGNDNSSPDVEDPDNTNAMCNDNSSGP